MPDAPPAFTLHRLIWLSLFALGLCGCSANQPAGPKSSPAAPVAAAPARAPAPPPVARPVVLPRIEVPPEVFLGIDVLQAGNFLALRGKRIGLLTHPAGVNRHGVSTIEILRHAPGVKLVALFGAEHGIYDNLARSTNYPDKFDPRTGLMIYSLYNGNVQQAHRPTKAELKGIDALVIDLQDIGTRSYTFAGSMKQAMEGCFENNVEVIVLDRPNPLGGLKVDGPPMDPSLLGAALVNAFPVPYVHGLTIGELARFAKGTPGVLRIPEADRLRGRLVVVPMVGWRREMRWPDTGLTWVPTSPNILDFPATVGYAMTGLGCQIGNFRSGVGNQYMFRGISNSLVKTDVLERELQALHLPGLQYRLVSVPNAHTGQPGIGIYVEVSDWDEWRPTELSFYLMKLACRLEPRNPFAAVSKADAEVFLHHLGSAAFFRDIAAHGARVDVAAYLREWQAQARAFQERSRQFWLYR